jgi:hypothetical protein
MAPPTSEQAMSDRSTNRSTNRSANRSINDPDVGDDLCSRGGLPHWADVAEELEQRDQNQSN